MFQSSSLVHGDEVPVPGTTVADLDQTAFRRYLREQYGEDTELEGVATQELLQNMNLMRDGL